MFDPLAFILGQDFLKLNIRPHDRLVSNKLAKFKLKCSEFIDNRLCEIKENTNILNGDHDEDII